MARLTPSLLSMIARSLIRRGEFCAVLDATPSGGLAIHPAATWDISGGPDEQTWIYRCDLAGPSGSESRTVPSAGVLHIRYAVDPGQPHRGRAALDLASSSAALAANLEHRLAEETGSPVGSYLPVPKNDGTDPDDEDSDPLGDLRADIRTAAGRQLVVESMGSAWGEGKGAAPTGDWRPHRFGAAPPDVLNLLRTNVGQAVLSACGVPVSLVTDADGTSQRESLRRWVHGPVAALAAIVGGELSVKLDTPVSFGFANLYAQDLVGRSSSLARLVKAQVPLDEARKVCGI